MKKLVRQPNSTTCGQSCIAMALDISVDDAIAMVGHDGITSDDEMVRCLATQAQFEFSKPENSVVAVQKHRSPDGSKEHWTYFYKGKTFDPANIGSRLWPVYKHIKIDWEK